MYDVLIHPVVSEKAVNMIESDNKIVFKVAKFANKFDVKDAIESLYGVDVVSVNIINDVKGFKKAIIKLGKSKATELASKLGMI